MKILALNSFAFAALAVVGAAPVRSDVIFSNLGPGDTFSKSGAWEICSGCPKGGQDRYSVAFTLVNGDQLLDSIDLPLSGSGDLDLELTADAGGVPGAPLEAFHVSFGSTGNLFVQPSVLRPLLHAGAQYWLVASASSNPPSAGLAWIWNTTGDTGLDAFAYGSCSLSKGSCIADSVCPSGELCEPDPQAPWQPFRRRNPAYPRGAFRVTGLAAPTPVCGNGVTEGSEECDDGNTVDGDGCGSDCNISCDATVTKANLKIGRLNTPQGDDTLIFSGQATLPNSSGGLNPLANGARLLIHDSVGGVLELAMPAGAVVPFGSFGFNGVLIGWKVNKSGTTSTWSNLAGSAPGGIYKFTMQDKSKKTPGLMQFSIHGKGGSFAISEATLPLTAVIVLDVPTGQCGRASFPGPKPVPSCILNASGSTLTCK